MMQLISDKTMNCPFCILPITGRSYTCHLQECRDKDIDLLQFRLRSFSGIAFNKNVSNAVFQLIEEYIQFISYDRSYYPVHWCDDHQLINTEFFDVKLNSKEAETIKRRSENTVIKRIERIQNKELYLRFLHFKAKHQGRDSMLFHGTKEENVNLICNQGFDRGHSKNGLHGFGIYLSSTISYSLAFAPKSDLHHRCILLCRTWLTSDSTISDNIHVIHDDFAVYPEYILYLED